MESHSDTQPDATAISGSCALTLDSERLHQVHLKRDWVDASNFRELKLLVLDAKRHIDVPKPDHRVTIA